MILEASFTFIHNVCSTGITYDDHQFMIVICLQYRPLETCLSSSLMSRQNGTTTFSLMTFSMKALVQSKDIGHEDIQHLNIQCKGIQHKNIKHKNVKQSLMTFSIATLSINCQIKCDYTLIYTIQHNITHHIGSFGTLTQQNVLW